MTPPSQKKMAKRLEVVPRTFVQVIWTKLGGKRPVSMPWHLVTSKIETFRPLSKGKVAGGSRVKGQIFRSRWFLTRNYLRNPVTSPPASFFAFLYLKQLLFRRRRPKNQGLLENCLWLVSQTKPPNGHKCFSEWKLRLRKCSELKGLNVKPTCDIHRRCLNYVISQLKVSQ